MKNRPGGYKEKQYVEEYDGKVKNNSQIADTVLMEQLQTNGTVFRINWDGTEYICFAENDFIGDTAYKLYPFVITGVDVGELFQGATVQVNDENEHTLKIEALIFVNVPIDDAYLPLNNIKSIGKSASLYYNEQYPNDFGNNVYFAIGENNSSETGVAGGKGCLIGSNNHVDPSTASFLVVGNYNDVSQQMFDFVAIGDNLNVKKIYRGICLGEYNEVGTNQYGLVIGNGSSIKSHNAFMVDLTGKLIVPSSTSGSSKYFAITVDDTGEIKATEVTI